jgi:hypothetical protein
MTVDQKQYGIVKDQAEPTAMEILAWAHEMALSGKYLA